MINYQILADSIPFYENHGFTRIESPWTVSSYVDDLTRPKDKLPFKLAHKDKCLVASGEQSFLYLFLKNFLPKGKYQTITPCYRMEAFDFTHTKYFMKNELIITDTVDDHHLNQLVNVARRFLQNYIPNEHLYVEPTIEGWDIMWKKYDDKEPIELGSYGIRQNDVLTYLFGTGISEPRLSRVISLENRVDHSK